MPYRAPMRCTWPGCPNLSDQSRCQEHRRAEDEDRGTRTERGYGAQWQRVRARKLARDPLCEDCKARGVLREAAQVHHIDSDNRNNRPENLESVCTFCHAAKRKG